MRKFISSVVMAITLAGCNPTINGKDVEAAVEYCADKGGVYSVNLFADDSVQCARTPGAKFLHTVRKELGDNSAKETTQP